MWQLSSSAPGAPCLSASPPVTLRIVLIMPLPSPGQRFCHGLLPRELSSLLLGLHTYTPLVWICWVSGLCLKCVLLFKSPSGACFTCPPPLCLALGCFLLASLQHQSWAVLHHLALTRLPAVTAKAAAFLSSHLIVLLYSFSAAEPLIPRGGEEKLSEQPPS